MDISSKYSTLRSTSLDIVMLARNYIVVPKPRRPPVPNDKADTSFHSESKQMATSEYETAAKCADYAKRELVRYINAGHLCLLALVSTTVINTDNGIRRTASTQTLDDELVEDMPSSSSKSQSVSDFDEAGLDQSSTPVSFPSARSQRQSVRLNMPSSQETKNKSKYEDKIVHDDGDNLIDDVIAANGVKTNVVEMGSIRSSTPWRHGSIEDVAAQPDVVDADSSARDGFGLGRFRVKLRMREKWGKVLLHDLIFSEFSDDTIITEEVCMNSQCLSACLGC